MVLTVNYYYLLRIREGTPNRIARLIRVLTQRVITPTLFNCGSEIPAEGRVTLVRYIILCRERERAP